MTIPVLIDSLAEELDILPDQARIYLNRKTGEYLTVPNHDMGIVEEGEEETGEFEWDWLDEDVAKLCEIAESDDWFALPDKFEIHEWSVMQRFADSEDESLTSSLNRAIHGRGAFRAFRNELDRSGETERWYQFKHEHLVSVVAEVLTERGVPFKRGRG